LALFSLFERDPERHNLFSREGWLRETYGAGPPVSGAAEVMHIAGRAAG